MKQWLVGIDNGMLLVKGMEFTTEIDKATRFDNIGDAIRECIRLNCIEMGLKVPKKLKDAIKQQFSGIKHTAGENLDKTRNLSYDKLIGNTEVTNTKASAHKGALIAQEPLKDIPANISSEGNETLSLPSHLQNNQNIMTNNITVTQNITGDNAVEIAEAGADILVAGSAVFGAEDIIKRTAEFKNL